MNRRGFLQVVLATGVAPAVLPSGIIMPIKSLWTQPDRDFIPLGRFLLNQGNAGGSVVVRQWIPFANVHPIIAGEFSRDASFGFIDITMTVEEYKAKYGAVRL